MPTLRPAARAATATNDAVTTPEIGHDLAAEGLIARYRRLVWLVATPVFLLLALLALWQAQQAHRGLISDLERRATAQQAALEALARSADYHVRDLRRVIERELVAVPRPPDPAVREALTARRSAVGNDGYTLDGLSPLLQLETAQLLSVENAPGPNEAVLPLLQALSQSAELAHQRNADLAWSYHFGWPRQQVMIFPWTPSAEVVESLGLPGLVESVAGWYGYEVFTGGMPSVNPLRKPYWTEAYQDAGGRGLMVTHASPVYGSDEFRGVVGADIKLATIARTLGALPQGIGRWWVVSERGEVLAESAPAAAGGTAGSAASAAASTAPPASVPKAAERLPAGLDAAALAQAVAARGQAHGVAGHQVVGLPLVAAPWTLVTAVTDRELRTEVLPRLLPFVLIATGLLAMFAYGQWLMRRRLLDPALSVMAYLDAKSRDDAAPEPELGRRWQPWARTVTRTFRQQREASDRERRSEAYKAAIVDNALAAIVTTDDDGRIVEFNPAAEALFGQARAAVLGRPVGEVIVPERFRAGHRAGMERMRRGGPAHVMGKRLEMAALRADGSEIPVEMILWRTEVDGEAHYTASLTDLSARRDAAQQIERQREALRQSEKLTAMGSLLAGVAHELNNPLAIVLGRASLLEEKCADLPELHGDAVRIREAAERCGRIVRTFLNMARSRPAQRSEVSLNDLARAAADMLAYTYRSHGIQLQLDLQPDLPQVLADGDQIGQVVLNLMVNAQQVLAAVDGGRHVVVRTGTEAPRPGRSPRVWLRVVDDGPGVGSELRERIFEPFFTTKPEGIGTGLGLAVSRSLAREHGGELQLEVPAEGAVASARPGASFRLSLPIGADAATAVAAVSAPAPLVAGDDTRATKVLVVDDEADIADLMRSMLEGAGHEVVTAESGAVALEMLEMVQFDAIVSDLRMPDMDGAALWRAVRERDPALATRMLFVTGDTLSPAARRFLDEARCPSLDKPFSKEDLLARVADRLARPAH